LHLAGSGFLFVLLRSRGGAPARRTTADAPTPAPHKSPLLRTLGGIGLVGSLGASILDYSFKVHVTEAWGRDNDLLRFFACFHAGVALLSFLAQSAGTKVMLEKFGLGK